VYSTDISNINQTYFGTFLVGNLYYIFYAIADFALMFEITRVMYCYKMQFKLLHFNESCGYIYSLVLKYQSERIERNRFRVVAEVFLPLLQKIQNKLTVHCILLRITHVFPGKLNFFLRL